MRLLIRRSLVRAQGRGAKKRKKIEPLQRCNAFFTAGRILEASNIAVMFDVADRTTRVIFHSVDQRRAHGAMPLRATDNGAMHTGDGTLDALGSHARRRSVERALRWRRAVGNDRQAFKTKPSSLSIACASCALTRSTWRRSAASPLRPEAVDHHRPLLGRVRVYASASSAC